ncbi:Diphthamide biosynthesis protein 1 [Dothidotthia symphoricarpi CBS 119687]|uniref:2-(3-amino-3-carboxypropyl)histidine synthase subunit 1 n=1 Tax=Dothidotthia symphoricarpi CBS 119687 TaxID=1392245 RepID=A0A6A6AI42_9PLEO|nr:Diphthamide biosynthesis protein 1 [Dothidotthia symphoricarpi CBS 119687]KAF2130765.1 Diphthamide biosynthesis protein 1 [Dothidotthia symphoricarpi CBS 119687]
MEDDRAATNLGPEVEEGIAEEPAPVPKQPRRRFVGRKTAEKGGEQQADPNANIEDSSAIQVAQPRRTARALNAIPESILHDQDINDAIALLPPNYNFEIHKCIHRIRTSGAKSVALQLPEGLLLFATTISDILTQFCPGISTLIMGDVTYGACCIDDYTARALGCDLLIHYAHSCLIPVPVTKIATLYIFVSISIDTTHLMNTITQNFPVGKTLALVGTIQFNATIHGIVPLLRREGYTPLVPQIAPLSKGEVLGCTSPSLPLTRNQLSKTDKQQEIADLILYLGDGRFHLESAMIANPTLPAYRYDPYSRRLTHETYAHDTLYDMRRAAILTARKARTWGVILGALGRQGNPHTLSLIEGELSRQGIPCIKLLLSEIFPGKLALMGDVQAWVQIACPRLSIDWGYAFPRPLLSPYEALVALGVRGAPWLEETEGGGAAEERGGKEGAMETGERGGKERERRNLYPMDFYAREGLGRTTLDHVRAATAAGEVGVHA